MKKKVFAVFMAILMSFAFIGLRVNAEGEEVTTTGEREPIHVIVFHGETCPHCQEAFEWFDSIEEEYGNYFDLEKYEVWNDQSNSELMEKVASYLGEEAEGVPYIIVGTETFSGFTDSYKQNIIDAIMEEYNKNAEERTNVVYNVLNNVEKEEEKDNTSMIIFILIVLAVVAFVIFARNGQDTAEMKFESKKQKVLAEDDYDDEDDEDEDDDDDDEDDDEDDDDEVVVRTSKKVKHSSKSSSTKTATKSPKKSNKKKSKK